jgi:hypothetical protein
MRSLALALAALLTAALVGGCPDGGTKPGPKGPNGDEGYKPAPGIQVSRCYQQEVERRGDRSFIGKVTVKLRIGKDGKASKVEILESTLKSPPVEQCIIEQITGWNMPELPNAIMWTWTFEFQPAW